MTTIRTTESPERIDGSGQTSGGASIELPRAPSAGVLWTRALVVATALVTMFLLDRLSAVMLDFWLLQSLGYESVFWTNFWTGTVLFIAGLVLFSAAIAVPALLHGVSRLLRRCVVWVGVLCGIGMGWFLAREYLEFLAPTADPSFNETDPVFGHDISFYVFDLPAIEIILQTLFWLALAALISGMATALAGSSNSARPAEMSGFVWRLGRLATPYTLGALLSTGLFAAANIWLGRYDLLLRENFTESTEFTGRGAQYLDVTGFFSTEHSIYVEALAILLLTVGLTVKLITARRAIAAPASMDLRKKFGVAAIALVLLPGITADLAFRSGVAIRDELFVTPNEPRVQLPYLQRHIDATNKAFGLDAAEESTFVPASGDDPPPDLDQMLDGPAVNNAPLWSGFTQRYSRMVAPQYIDRILLAEGDMTVYGPTQEILQAQQKLRPYYDFLDVDTTVHEADGEPAMFASAARELPQDEVRPWLDAWGQRSIMFTHGHGLVTMPVAERDEAGEPVYATGGIPTQSRFPSLSAENEAFYYGEGSVVPAFSKAVGVAEHDRPTDQGRAEVQDSPGATAGIEMDSLLKRVVIGYQEGDFINVVFSDLIGDETRAHVYRLPLERVEQIAPFLSLDTDPYAAPAGEGMNWMVNAMTTSYSYPYSGVALLGDNSDLRTEERPLEEANYAADSVKATVDARTGAVDFYRISDEPVVETWSQIYPDLFKSDEEMPDDVREQMQYPQALMSIQFNEIYPFYHQKDALTFYSSEDLLDDADEVLGPIRGESGAITFSQGLYNWMASPGGAMTGSSENTQFALSKNYTPQDALNLRGIATAYQTGDEYGKLSVLKVPKGEFYPGPEQADATIDQDAFIAQQIGLWNRQGVEVIRGSTSLLVVEDEALYVEPVFIRSRQNPVPQLQRVIVVFRGEAHMGRTMEEALRFAIEGGRLDDPDLTADSAAVPATQGAGAE